MTKTKVEAVKAARVWCLAALLAFAGLAHADLVGSVVAIQDGDTIDVLVNRQPVRVRLAQIDAPEKRQALGTRSRQALADLVFRQSVRVAETGRDRYGRVIGTVYLGNVDVNAQMVREGTRSGVRVLSKMVPEVTVPWYWQARHIKRVRLAAAWYLTNQKQGVSALGLQRVLGLGSYQTAWTMLHRFPAV